MKKELTKKQVSALSKSNKALSIELQTRKNIEFNRDIAIKLHEISSNTGLSITQLVNLACRSYLGITKKGGITVTIEK